MVESEEAVAEALLKAVGVDDHEPEVVGMVLDAMHRAARDALGDARDLALHRNETQIEAHDVRAGDDLNAAAGYSRRPPPARENAIAAAASVNAAPLNLADGHGVRLPREGNLTTRGRRSARTTIRRLALQPGPSGPIGPLAPHLRRPTLVKAPQPQATSSPASVSAPTLRDGPPAILVFRLNR